MGPGNKSRDESPETGRVSLFPIRCVNVVGQARGGQQSVWRLLRRRLGAIALQHGVDESEALLEAVERHEGAHARAFLLPQQNLAERLEPIAQILVAVLLADRVDLVLDRLAVSRSEARRVGKACGSTCSTRGWPDHKQKKK